MGFFIWFVLKLEAVQGKFNEVRYEIYYRAR